MPARRLLPLALAGLFASACFIIRNAQVSPLEPVDQSKVSSRARAHLVDGSIVVYEQGFAVRNRWVIGEGRRYGLRLELAPVTSIRLDDIIAMEQYTSDLGEAVFATLLASAAATAVTVGGAAAIIHAVCPKCFGSCPTIYSDSAGVEVLEAEGFSLSIAPIFEARDVDRLRVSADSGGTVRLEVRNEALETHYINHLELLEVTHDASERAVPDPAGSLLLVRGLAPVLTAQDRAGRHVAPTLAQADGVVYRTDSTVLGRAAEADLADYIDLELPPFPGADSVALVFRLRNSLLNTVLFYDLMIADRGPTALDWMAQDLESLGTAVALGRFAREEMGLRVMTAGDTGWKETARLPDTGPVAWKDVAVTIPVRGAGRQRVRLSFVADNWRIDQVAFARGWRRGTVTPVPPARVIGPDERLDPDALENLRRPDNRYLRTSAGDRFTMEFEAGPRRAAGAAWAPRTFFLASQGYYIEWVRRAWLEPKTRPPLPPGRAALAEAIRRWRTTQDSTERLFYATRVPMR